jgi:hypothetical protein
MLDWLTSRWFEDIYDFGQTKRGLYETLWYMINYYYCTAKKCRGFSREYVLASKSDALFILMV